ncbi:MAG TPA: histone deacetylase family protein, partial [Kiloniellaceae bacterium]|nr:histone deacetylase family protein [Kiloniellaceae bacterium]
MSTLLFSHPACEQHDPGPLHPENPGRLKAIMKTLDSPEFSELLRREAPHAEHSQIARVHPESFVHEVLAAIPDHGDRMLDADTIVSPGSGEAALRAAGAVVAAVDAVFAGEADNAFCAVRPPGHHAEPRQAMG